MPSVKIDTTATVALVAAAAGKRYRVHAFSFSAGGTVNVKFQSNTTDLTGAFPMVANGVVTSGYSPDGHFDCAVGEALNVNLSGSVQVSGWLVYSVIG